MSVASLSLISQATQVFIVILLIGASRIVVGTGTTLLVSATLLVGTIIVYRSSRNWHHSRGWCWY